MLISNHKIERFDLSAILSLISFDCNHSKNDHASMMCLRKSRFVKTVNLPKRHNIDSKDCCSCFFLFPYELCKITNSIP